MTEIKAKESQLLSSFVSQLYVWSPLAMISGIYAAHAGLLAPWGWPVALVGVLISLLALKFPHLPLKWLGIFGGLFLLGVGFAHMETASKAPPIKRAVTASVVGQVLQLENHRQGHRLLVRPVSFESSYPIDLPKRLRFTARSIEEGVQPGDMVAFRGRFSPPPSPVSPFGFQFQKWTYYRDIAAIGFAFDTVNKQPVLEGQTQALPLLYRVRLAIADKIEAELDGDKAGLVIALSTGLRDSLSEEAQEALRTSGLAHILAISGLHMALVSGGVFFALRLVFSSFLGWAERYPIKKWAALGALMVATIYLALSGASVATQRAYVMIGVAFVAILVDRPAISLRNLVIAAFIIASIYPHTVTEPGFQMSFAATLALICVYRSLPERLKERDRAQLSADTRLLFLARGALSFARLIGFTLLTSLVAGLATSPFAAFHFERLATYGLFGNLLVMPLFSFVVMPLVVAVLVLIPLGLETLPLKALDYALEPLFFLATYVADLPGAVHNTGRLEGWAIAACVIGGMWALVFKGRLRFIGVPIMCLVFFGRAESYDAYISADRKSAILRLETGGYARLTKGGSNFAHEVWLSQEGRGYEVSLKSFRHTRECDGNICELSWMGGRAVAAKDWQSYCESGITQPDLLIILQSMRDKSLGTCVEGVKTYSLERASASTAIKWQGSTVKEVAAKDFYQTLKAQGFLE